MDIKINGKLVNNPAELVSEVDKLLKRQGGPIRKETEFDSVSGRTIFHFRSRNIFEYLGEKLFYSAEKKEDIKNEFLASIAHIMSPLINKAAAEEDEKKRKNLSVVKGKTDSSSNQGAPKNSEGDDAYNENLPGNSREYSVSAKDLRECFRKLNGKVFKKKAEEHKILIPKIGSRLGLFQVPEGLNVCICPALQVIANNVIVSSVGAQAISCVRQTTPLKRALEAFVKAWRDFAKQEKSPSEVYGELPSNAGLQHIKHLLCVGDSIDRGRHNNCDPFFDLSMQQWERFYSELLSPMEGTVVLQLYPDFYEDDLSVASGRVPYFSKNNIAGAVSAAFQMNSKSRKDGRPPISIMFAGVNGIVANAIAKIIENKRLDELCGPRLNAGLKMVRNEMKALASARKENYGGYADRKPREIGQSDGASSTLHRDETSSERKPENVQLITLGQKSSVRLQSALLDDDEK